MSSAIEAVKEVVPLKQSSDVVANENALTEGNNGVVGDPRDESLRNDVYTAAANGDLERLQRLVEYEGCSLTEPDGLGYYALQWAALYNRTVAAQYIIKHGGDVHATDHYGQTALHWSAVGGAIQVAEVLLQEGAAVNAADIHGYQIAHVAAQYGQTGFLYHILSKWNADPDVPDNDGRSPLHWAAYKGFADCIRLLLFLDAHRGRQDKEGYTPLHLAANKGNLEACRVLVKHGGKLEDLMVTDNGGNTPKQLASDKNHTKVGSFLDTARRMHEEEYDNNNTFPTFRTLCISYFVQSIMLVTYIRSVIMAPHFPKLTARFGILAWLGVFLASAGSLMHYRCSSKDPGYIHMNVRNPENMKDYEPLLKIVINNPTLLAGNWSKLCSTCKIIWPLRAKHCSTCNRCVEQFDHHCEIVSNCIGKKNKRDFFIFLVLEASATLIAGRVTIKRILKDPMARSSFLPRMIHVARRRTGAILFLIADFYLFICFAAYTAVQTHQISQNITMYESLKKLRYSDLKDADVLFKIPYDHGCRKNWSDFLLKGYNEDVEVSEMQMNTKLQDGDLHNLTKRNDHVAVNVDSSNTNAHDGQVHSSDCIHSNDSKSKT